MTLEEELGPKFQEPYSFLEMPSGTLLGCTPKGSYNNTQRSKKGSEKVLERVLEKGSQKGSEKGPAMGFTVQKGSEKGSQKGFWEGGFQKVPRTPPCRVRPLGVRPNCGRNTLGKFWKIEGMSKILKNVLRIDPAKGFSFATDLETVDYLHIQVWFGAHAKNTLGEASHHMM